MVDSTFDPKSVLDAYRTAFAPLFKAQQEAVQTLERASHYHYALAGDYLELGLAQAKATVGAGLDVFFARKILMKLAGRHDA